jgi:fructosamine-3-kinase
MAMLPEVLKKHLQELANDTVDSVRPATGGSINQAAIVGMSGGERFFIKWNSSANTDMFTKEAMGLRLLAGAGANLVIPDVIKTGSLGNGLSYLFQEYVEEGRPRSYSAADFGHSLAHLHRSHAARFGLNFDNYIGYLPQSNSQHADWATFFIEERLKPQLQIAVDKRRLDTSTITSFERLYRRIPDIFPDEPPSLLHGDLWSGNYFYDTEGRAVVFDPAVYYGHREMELAFTRLFGGFSSDFYHAYEEAYPPEPEVESRVDICNLYPLLVHTNIFGGSYARQVETIVNRFNT